MSTGHFSFVSLIETHRVCFRFMPSTSCRWQKLEGSYLFTFILSLSTKI